MSDTSTKSPFISRRTLLRLAWILLALALLIPAPSGSFAGDAFGISAFYVVGKGIVWSEAAPGSPGSLGFWRSALLALALFTNIAYLFAPYLRRCATVSLTWKAILLVMLVVDGSVALLIPEFARLPAYWIWLLSIALIVIALTGFPGIPAPAAPKSKASRAPLDNGEVPPFFWVMLAWTLFWIAVSAGNYAQTLPSKTTTSANAPLSTFITDHANVLHGDEATQLGAALDNFEKETSNQIAVAIYPRVPETSIEAFTIGIADRSHLGRKGIDNGAILFVFMNERTARIEVGYGFEGLLTDVEAHRILDEVLAPAFARGQYFEGIDATLGAIFTVVQDAY
ncbi:MAG: TPM domain-containing protein, partial [Betaproteobacteria bacterium]